MPSLNYYDILEISPDASAEVIRAAYRSLCRKYHPDTKPDAEGVKRFRSVQEAWEGLSDPEKRRQYDEQLGKTGHSASGGLNNGQAASEFGDSSPTDSGSSGRRERGSRSGLSPLMKTLFAVLVGAGLATILSPDRGRQVPGLSGHASFEATVARIVDGDTLYVSTADLEETEIRLYGVDTPEDDQAFGAEATRLLSELVDGKKLTVVEHGLDQYGRTVAELFVDGVSINNRLVEAGMAWHSAKYAPKRDDLADAEKDARQANRGLWQEEAVPPWEWRRNRSNNQNSTPKPQTATAQVRLNENRSFSSLSWAQQRKVRAFIDDCLDDHGITMHWSSHSISAPPEFWSACGLGTRKTQMFRTLSASQRSAVDREINSRLRPQGIQCTSDGQVTASVEFWQEIDGVSSRIRSTPELRRPAKTTNGHDGRLRVRGRPRRLSR